MIPDRSMNILMVLQWVRVAWVQPALSAASRVMAILFLSPLRGISARWCGRTVLLVVLIIIADSAFASITERRAGRAAAAA